MSTTELAPTKVSVPKGHRIGSPIHSLQHKFLPIPHLPEETEMLPAGAVTFGIEARIFVTPNGEVSIRGASIHVFDTETQEEFIRFDGFGPRGHYHYLHPTSQTNELLGFDDAANGDFYEWAIASLRARMAQMLRKAGAEALARKIETQGFMTEVLDRLPGSIERALKRSNPGTDMVVATNRWHERWKRIHPQFDTYGDEL